MFDQALTRPPAPELSPTQLLRVIEFENGADTFADADRTTSDSETGEQR